MSSNWCELPLILCPHCDKEFREDDYCNIDVGDETECPHCKSTIYFNDSYTEPIINILVETKPV